MSRPRRKDWTCPSCSTLQLGRYATCQQCGGGEPVLGVIFKQLNHSGKKTAAESCDCTRKCRSCRLWSCGDDWFSSCTDCGELGVCIDCLPSVHTFYCKDCWRSENDVYRREVAGASHRRCDWCARQRRIMHNLTTNVVICTHCFNRYVYMTFARLVALWCASPAGHFVVQNTNEAVARRVMRYVGTNAASKYVVQRQGQQERQSRM